VFKTKAAQDFYIPARRCFKPHLNTYAVFNQEAAALP
jgi:hypothetical protein